MKTNSPKTNRKTWLAAALGWALLILFAQPQTVSAQQWTGPDGNNNISNTNTGNVGIGTATPSTRLHVVGDATFSNNIAINGATLKSWSGGKVLQGTTGAFFMGTLGNIQVISNAYDPANWKYMGNGPAANMYMYQGDTVFRNAVSGSADANVNWLPRMIITAGGKVGIGTTTPSTPLHVVGDATLSNNIAINGATLKSWQSGKALQGTTGAVFLGNVGDTHVISNAYDPANWRYMGNGTAANMYMYQGNTVFRNAVSGSADANVNWVNRMIITADGNVGIGTTTPAPAYKLDVNGEINATGFRINGTPISTGGPVASVFGRTGAVVAATGDYTWAQVDKSTSSLADLQTRNASDLNAGTVPIQRLGLSGSADVTTFLRGDNTWATVPSSQWISGTNNISYSSGNVGIGTTTPNSSYMLDVNGNTNITGNINVTGNINAKYQDVAEWVPSRQKLQAGTVVVLDAEKSNHVLASELSYDTRVAGVVSAQPGVLLGEGGEGKLMVATTGRVRVKVDATRAPIQIGDLLVTGDTPGVAMKSEPIELGGRKMHMPGTLIGKALEPLAKGKGEILVLLSLQ